MTNNKKKVSEILTSHYYLMQMTKRNKEEIDRFKYTPVVGCTREEYFKYLESTLQHNVSTIETLIKDKVEQWTSLDDIVLTIRVFCNYETKENAESLRAIIKKFEKKD